MASVFVVKGKMDTPKEWYTRETGSSSEWEYDELLKAYHTGEVYMEEREDRVSFEDMSENEFFGWDTSSWITLAGDKELIYGYYSEDNCSAEFVHIRDGACVRDYRIYESEVDTDEGADPSFDGWTDVAEYVDKNLL